VLTAPKSKELENAGKGKLLPKQGTENQKPEVQRLSVMPIEGH